MTESSLQPKKIVIIGGVAGGMSAAARARRLSERSQILVLERSGYVSFANCGLPYYLGREIASRDDLIVQTPSSLKDRFNLEVRVHQEVTDIDPEKKLVTFRDTKSGRLDHANYDELILSVGAAAIKPKLPGIDLPGIYTVRNIEDIDRIDSWIAKEEPRSVVVVGGGFIGLEIAEQFARRGLDVTVIEGQSQVLPPTDPEMAELVHQELRKHGVKLHLNSFVKEFQEPNTIKEADKNPKSCWVCAGEQNPIPADLVILGLGIRPEVELARKAGLRTGKLGGILVDEYLQTSAAHIWAVGDAIEIVQPINNQHALIALGGPANRQGRLVADNIIGSKRAYTGTIGTAIVRVFDLTVATTGLNETQLNATSLPYEAIYLHPSNHAGYYPGAERLDFKILFHKISGALLGAQIIGKQGVDKRIDVLATALLAKMSVRNLADLELAYAPPFGSAKDPINLAGMIGANVLDGISDQVQWREIASLSREQFCLLDVRSNKEREMGFIPGSIHIPLPELRKRMTEIPASKTIVTYCQSGQRSYFASRLLKQSGFTVKNLSGGYLTWKTMATPVNTTEGSPRQIQPALSAG